MDEPCMGTHDMPIAKFEAPQLQVVMDHTYKESILNRICTSFL